MQLPRGEDLEIGDALRKGWQKGQTGNGATLIAQIHVDLPFADLPPRLLRIEKELVKVGHEDLGVIRSEVDGDAAVGDGSGQIRWNVIRRSRLFDDCDRTGRRRPRLRDAAGGRLLRRRGALGEAAKGLNESFTNSWRSNLAARARAEPTVQCLLQFLLENYCV